MVPRKAVCRLCCLTQQKEFSYAFFTAKRDSERQSTQKKRKATKGNKRTGQQLHNALIPPYSARAPKRFAAQPQLAGAEWLRKDRAWKYQASITATKHAGQKRAQQTAGQEKKAGPSRERRAGKKTERHEHPPRQTQRRRARGSREEGAERGGKQEGEKNYWGKN
jgi:hypothetical protein